MNAEPRITGPITFLNRTYGEAIELLVEARDYMAAQEAQDRELLAGEDRLAFTLEASRLTTMLAHIVAWLLLQRAVMAGELTREAAAAPEHRLGGHDVCADQSGLANETLPRAFRQLLLRGHALYTRVSRLDELVGRQSETAAVPCPVS